MQAWGFWHSRGGITFKGVARTKIENIILIIWISNFMKFQMGLSDGMMHQNLTKNVRK